MEVHAVVGFHEKFFKGVDEVGGFPFVALAGVDTGEFVAAFDVVRVAKLLDEVEDSGRTGQIEI